MRKANKKDLLEMIKTLCEAQNTAQGYMEAGDGGTAIALLTDCQDAAIGMGENIEASEGENAPTISHLQAYCEALYQVAVAAQEGGDVASRFEALSEALQQVEASIEKDIKVRKEVVFLPYKASMWDSLESVWKAAAADPDCDAYVIPIPYYDKNPDGSFKKIHYEGGQYPPEVPVVWYEDYDFAARRPDVIFIHYPYDEYNYVTSVAPFFYTTNLKQYTEQLVYIPYFVLGEIDPEDDVAVEKMSHFCTLPGVIETDKVIVQSEKMRQAYIKVMTDFAGPQSKSYWEEKILGLGSPKFDKVVTAQEEKFAVPEGWRCILNSSIGKRKKIILYNTTIAALLEHEEVMLDKMERVFQMFYERREEIALWWRPHPLVQSTLMAMRPNLWNRYSEMLRKYKEEGWGIYDDTPELDRALALSDAYFGDGSSVVQLYEKTGKPIMIQNCTVQ